MRVGVDIIEVERIERAIVRHGERFFRRFFTEEERMYAQNKPERLAVRIAAKEAVGKALGTGLGEIKWTEIEVAKDANKRPVLRLYGTAARLAAELGLTHWEISLSHTRDNAIAYVIATSKET